MTDRLPQSWTSQSPEHPTDQKTLPQSTTPAAHGSWTRQGWPAYQGDGEGVADPEAGLEVQGGAHSSQLAICHDSDAVSQDVSFLHAVRGQHNGSPLFVPPDHFPCESASRRKGWSHDLGQIHGFE